MLRRFISATTCFSHRRWSGLVWSGGQFRGADIISSKHDCRAKQGCIQQNKQNQIASVESGACSASTCNLFFPLSFLLFPFNHPFHSRPLSASAASVAASAASAGIGCVGGFISATTCFSHRLWSGLVWSGLVWWAVSGRRYNFK